MWGSLIFALIQLVHVVCATAGVSLSTGFISVAIFATGPQAWYAWFVVAYVFAAVLALHLIPWRYVVALASRGMFALIYLAGIVFYLLLMAVPFALRRRGDPFELNAIGQSEYGMQLLDPNVVVISMMETVLVSMGIVGGGLVHNPFMAFVVANVNIIGQSWRMGALRKLAFDSVTNTSRTEAIAAYGEAPDFQTPPIWTAFVWTAMGAPR